jgi:D-proline reductase (dithiol) PrdB
VSEPIRYIERTRDYYAALGYAPYRWAEHADVPFVRPRAPLARSRLVLLTTAAPYRPELPDQGPGAAYNAAAKFYHVYDVPVSPTPDLRISHIGYDRVHSTARDPNTWLPVARLFEAVGEGRIGALAERVIGVPTNRSQRVTVEQDAPEVLARARTLDADLALLVPNCPVCHQSMSLMARYLEANGIATVVMGCALDIVERCGVPRFLFSDFPLGNSAGRPFDTESQRATLASALALFDDATAPRTTRRSPQRWADDDAWKRDFMNIDGIDAATLEAKRAEFAEQKAIAKSISR